MPLFVPSIERGIMMRAMERRLLLIIAGLVATLTPASAQDCVQVPTAQSLLSFDGVIFSGTVTGHSSSGARLRVTEGFKEIKSAYVDVSEHNVRCRAGAGSENGFVPFLLPTP